MNTEDLRQKLNQQYSRENWLSILSFVFPQLQLIRAYEISEKPEFVNQFYQLDFVELADGMKLAVLELEVDKDINLPKNRIKLRQSTHKFIDDVEYQGVLAVYYSRDKKEYRFTFSAKEGVFENGKFAEKETAKNRYTYLLGESEVCRTAAKRFQMLSEMGSSMQIEDVKIAFSVEALNKDFYTKIQKAFYEFLGGKTDKKDYDGSLKLPSVNRETGSEIYKEFTVRLIGRLVFCWFLKHKKSESGVSLMPDSILSSESVA